MNASQRRSSRTAVARRHRVRESKTRAGMIARRIVVDLEVLLDEISILRDELHREKVYSRSLQVRLADAGVQEGSP